MREDWEILSVDKVCEVIAGQSPEGKYYNSEGNGLPFYQGKKEFTDKFIGEPKVWTSEITREAKAGDVLMSVRAPVGPVNFSTQHICIGRGLAAIRAGHKVDKDYLYNFLVKLESEITGNAGAVFNSINKKQIGEISIPIPPLSEQKQIVAILDQAFAAIDQAKANIKKNIQNAKDLFQSQLDQIFSQKGEDWEEKALIEITTKIGSGATPRGGQASYKDSGISLIRSMNVHDEGFREKKLAFIDDEQASRLDNVTIHENDVLLNITGASVARCCVVDNNYLPARVNQHVSIIRLQENVLNYQFLHYALTSRATKELLLGIGEQGATRQAITKAQIENFRISYPSNTEKQLELVSQLDTTRINSESLIGSYKRKQTGLEELKKSILQKAFAGELTNKELVA